MNQNIITIATLQLDVVEMAENSYDLKPSKEAYRAVKSDVTPVSAFKELIDNALDNWMRKSQRTDDIEITIEYYEGDDDEGLQGSHP